MDSENGGCDGNFNKQKYVYIRQMKFAKCMVKESV
jgi:hypothetical protein